MVAFGPLGFAPLGDDGTAGGSSAAVGLATETDTAFALTASQSGAAGLATETDTAYGLALATGVGMATETDTAYARVASSAGSGTSTFSRFIMDFAA